MEPQELANWIEDAVGDMAHSSHSMWKEYGHGNAALDALAKQGVMDIQGAYADNLYNDSGLLTDLLGDQIHDATIGAPEKRKAYIAELRSIKSFVAWNTALDNLDR